MFLSGQDANVGYDDSDVHSARSRTVEYEHDEEDFELLRHRQSQANQKTKPWYQIADQY